MRTVVPRPSADSTATTMPSDGAMAPADDGAMVSMFEKPADIYARSVSGWFAGWRWALVWAAAAASVVGYGFTKLPEWVELAIGIPAILGVYGWVIWRRGFGPDDRELFRMRKGSTE